MGRGRKITDITFLALSIWREARGESEECREGVAQVVLNRVAGGGWWGNTIMSVLFKRRQFSSLTEPDDPQLCTYPSEDDHSWKDCLTIAARAIEGQMDNPVGDADSYFDISIRPPYWADEETFVKQIGRINFHKVRK